MKYSRRNTLKLLAGSSLLAASHQTLARSSSQPASQKHERSLKLRNLHTGEYLDSIYWADGFYIPESLDEINYLLRDHRSNDVTRIDVTLLNTLNTLQQRLHSRSEVQVISAYRSPQTNEMLRRKGHQVAKRSLHLQGKAIDIRLPSRDLNDVRKTALNLQAGGVGYYPKNDFIHLDTGRIRQWG